MSPVRSCACLRRMAQVAERQDWPSFDHRHHLNPSHRSQGPPVSPHDAAGRRVLPLWRQGSDQRVKRGVRIMGSKGSQTSTTNQNQTYTPAGGSQIQGALTQAQNAAQLPFNIPQAQVAGFSQDQLSAFQNVNNAQGMAQPYINQASQNFTPQGAQSFFNPAVDAVTAQMQNIFGQQQQQNNANLTQAAGGVGADRIAVGQGNLANQQGLAAGQTMASLYAPSLQAAAQQQQIQQGAAYGQASLGSAAQNAALSGANAQLASGGLQQQLAQAQMNSPYQQQLAQAAFPYQQAQFLAGITGSLAPALGGTTDRK